MGAWCLLGVHEPDECKLTKKDLADERGRHAACSVRFLKPIFLSALVLKISCRLAKLVDHYESLSSGKEVGSSHVGTVLQTLPSTAESFSGKRKTNQRYKTSI